MELLLVARLAYWSDLKGAPQVPRLCSVADEVLLGASYTYMLDLACHFLALFFSQMLTFPFSEEHYEVAPANQTWVFSSSRKSSPYPLVDRYASAEIYSRNDLCPHATSLTVLSFKRKCQLSAVSKLEDCHRPSVNAP